MVICRLRVPMPGATRQAGDGARDGKEQHEHTRSLDPSARQPFLLRVTSMMLTRGKHVFDRRRMIVAGF